MKAINIRVFPNPTSESITISGLTNELTQIKIYNASGGLVKSQLVTSRPQNIDVSGLNTGVYLIHIWGKNNQQVTYKMVKE